MTRTRPLVLWTVAAGMAATVQASAQTPLVFASPFQDHAVLQRSRPIDVWGTAGAGDAITVGLAGRQASGSADRDGHWRITLPALEAGGPYTLEARSNGGATAALTDILIGDVFLCSGQSNMEAPVAQARGGGAAAARSANDRIRLLTVAKAGRPTPAVAFETAPTWVAARPDTVRGFSAVCYFFGREVHEAQKIPVGLITAAWAGTAIEPWFAASGLTRAGGFGDRLDLLALFAQDEDAAHTKLGGMWEAWWTQHGPSAGTPWAPADTAGWTDVPGLRNWKTWSVPALASHDGMVWFRRTLTLTAEQAAGQATLALGGIDEVDQTWVNGRAIRNTFGWGTRRTYTLPAGSLRVGENVVVVNVLSTWDAGGLLGPAESMVLTLSDGSTVALGDGWRYRIAALAMGRPPRAPWETIAGLTTLYNGMIAPLGSFGLRGVVWYQGETNADAPTGYETLLKHLMAGWREQFGNDLPFLVVQLPNFGDVPSAPVEANWASLREAQRRAVASDPHAGLAVTIDIGDRDDLHPGNKAEVGRRLARAARRVIYGEPIAPSGPVPIAARPGPTGIVVSFGDVDGSLVTYSANRAIGFEICGAAQGTCQYVSGTVAGSTVTLAWNGPRRADARRVRFCWGASPICNLSDRSGLPAGPFEIPIR